MGQVRVFQHSHKRISAFATDTIGWLQSVHQSINERGQLAGPQSS